jgi:hypothetical protein
MGLKSALAGLLLAAPLALAHPHPGGGREKVYQHAAVPRDERHLGSCTKRFEEDDFQAKRAEFHGQEFMRLRRAAGFEPEDRCVFFVLHAQRVDGCKKRGHRCWRDNGLTDVFDRVQHAASQARLSLCLAD